MADLKALFLPGPAVPEGQLPAEQYRYSAQDVRRLTGGMSSEGVLDVAGGEFRVSQRAQGASRVVQVAPGRAFIDGDNAPAQGTYFIQATSVAELTVAPNPPSGSRRDLVILEVLDGSVAGTDHLWRRRIVQGQVAAGAPIPAVPLTAIPLAVIGPITSSTGSITDDEHIRDYRVFARQAGYLNGPVTVPKLATWPNTNGDGAVGRVGLPLREFRLPYRVPSIVVRARFECDWEQSNVVAAPGYEGEAFVSIVHPNGTSFNGPTGRVRPKVGGNWRGPLASRTKFVVLTDVDRFSIGASIGFDTAFAGAYLDMRAVVDVEYPAFLTALGGPFPANPADAAPDF